MTPASLRQYRAQLSLTQAELALLLGVDVMTVSRWERGMPIAHPVILALALERLTMVLWTTGSKLDTHG